MVRTEPTMRGGGVVRVKGMYADRSIFQTRKGLNDRVVQRLYPTLHAVQERGGRPHVRG